MTARKADSVEVFFFFNKYIYINKYLLKKIKINIFKEMLVQLAQGELSFGRLATKYPEFNAMFSIRLY